MVAPSHAHRPRSRTPMIVVTSALAVAIGSTAAFMWPSESQDEAQAAPAQNPNVPIITGSAPPAGAISPPSYRTDEPGDTSEPTVQFTLVTSGDILTHTPVLTSARNAGDGDYNFAALMKGVRPYIRGADLALCHLEVPVSPPGTEPSGYPMFGAPAELVPAIAFEGWDGCSTASNHSVDRRFAGLETTLAALDSVALGHSGMARTSEEAASTQMYTVREGNRRVRVANISFTYGLNGLPKPDGMPWAVDTFDADARDVTPILDAAKAARDQGADIVIASTHCCVEYQVQPNGAQRSIVEQIANSGLVDLYVGHHAHVPQPIELIDGGVSGDGMWAYFGHGNYLSNQDSQCCVEDTNSGYLGVTTFTVDPDGAVGVDAQWIATTVDRLDGHKMYALADIVDTGAGKLSATEARARHDRVTRAVGDQATELTSPPSALAQAAFRVYRGGADTSN